MSSPNKLLNSPSPYLHKHAYSPICWYPWSAEALAIAEKEDIPIVLSIGYAACHWCEVMLRETFEDPEVAALMNKYFIAIKVDREEKPDIDKVYMRALQAMGLHTGWPLHVFLLPNQQPFYGGTYFTNAVWKKLLLQIALAFKNHRNQLQNSATAFTKALHDVATVPCNEDNNGAPLDLQGIRCIFQKIYQNLDLVAGGIAGEYKFPMPGVNLFLVSYYLLTGDVDALAQLKLTLTKMACGGIYDQLGGGFARYATDVGWNVPHFEKMLYDNAQLISLYAKSYLLTQEPLHREVVAQTIAFVVREMRHCEGGFYSAIAADSEGEEGRCYTWTIEEVIAVLGDEYCLFTDHYPMIPYKAQVKDSYIFHRKVELLSLTTDLHPAKAALFKIRSQRIQPEVDMKVLTSWNGMMLQALLDAYYAFGEMHYWELAYSNVLFIKKYLMEGNRVKHGYCNDTLLGSGYLEDYAWVVSGWISLYQMTLEETWLLQAASLVDYALACFGDNATSLLHMSESESNQLIMNPIEILDEVTPSGNAIMAHNLFHLGMLWQREDYLARAKAMLDNVWSLVEENAVYLTSWMHLYTLLLQKLTVAVVGSQCKKWAYEIKKKYPDVIVAGTMTTSGLPLLQNKGAEERRQGTSVYICHNQTCLLPLYNLEDVFMVLGKIYIG